MATSSEACRPASRIPLRVASMAATSSSASTTPRRMSRSARPPIIASVWFARAACSVKVVCANRLPRSIWRSSSCTSSGVSAIARAYFLPAGPAKGPAPASGQQRPGNCTRIPDDEPRPARETGPSVNQRQHNRGSVALLERPGRGAVLRPVTVGDRLGARLHEAALDRALASGAAPESDVALTLHARRLIAPRTRRRLARTLQGIVAAGPPPPPRAPGPPGGGRRAAARRAIVAPARRPPPRAPGPQVAVAGADLLALAERLARSAPVEARGVALVRMLLSDGGGPLHSSRASGLAAAAHAAALAL